MTWATDEALGATYLGERRCAFCVWAPRARQVAVVLRTASQRVAILEAQERGYFRGMVEAVEPGERYVYRLDNSMERPDPASRFQPDGVQGASQVVGSRFGWSDESWRGIPLSELIIYELHVGTFTPAGTFEAVIPLLPELKMLGITAIELMPIAQFPGERNWGYDGVDLFAVQNSYGGPAGLKRLVDACHREHLAVILDVVYNHLGPEGNNLPDFGPYFTDKYKTPWGPALNFDGPQSDEVRRFFIENALYWVTESHIDGLRLDAIHAIHDQSAYPFLAELGAAVHARGEQLERQVHLIAESDLNDARVVQRREQGGLGLDAQWSDDFHHALHMLLTGERNGYYQDFGSTDDLARTLRDGWCYTGCYSSFRQRRHGNDPRAVPADQFVVCAQNHDQVGNRMRGERLSQLTSLEGLKLAAGVVLLSPFLPLLFAGEEYGERAPFLYFVSHESPELVEAVRRGRREEFAAFAWQDEAPDPQDEQTFRRSKLDRGLATREPHCTLWAFYRELLRLRREVPALARLDKKAMEVVPSEDKRAISVRRWAGEGEVCALFGFGPRTEEYQMPWRGDWRRLLDSADTRWAGPGSVNPERVLGERAVTLHLQPQSFVLYLRDS